MDDPTIGEVGRTMLRLEAKVDLTLADHEARLRKTERWVYALPPTFILAAVSLAVALLGGRL